MITKSDIRLKAYRLLDATGQKNFPFSIEQIAASLGFECHFYIPDADIANIICTVSHLKRKIYINQHILEQQQRWQTARMIGCIVLYGADQDYIDNLIKKDQKENIQYFAECLLMPESIFQELWIHNYPDTELMARHFGVCNDTIIRRATALGIK